MSELTFPNSGLLFDEEEHRYYYNGRTLKSVTTLLKETVFINKYGDVDPEVLKKAAMFGTTVHKLIEVEATNDESIDNVIDNVIDEVYGTKDIDGDVFRNLMRVYTKAVSLLQHKVEPLKKEYLVHNGYIAGSIDCIAKVNGEYAIVDYKFTYEADIEYLSWQTSIYAYLFYKMTGQRISKAYALWVPKRDVELGWFKPIPMKSDEDIENLINGVIVTREDAYPAEINDARTALKVFLDMEKKIAEKKDELKRRFLEYMLANGVPSIDAGDYRVSLVNAFTKKTFDKKALEKAHPEININDFMKESEVSATIKFTSK